MEVKDFSNLPKKQLRTSPCCCIMGQKSVVITGGTGLIGQEAVQFFSEQGYALRILSRTKQSSGNKSVQYYQWNPSDRFIPEEALRGAYAIIHLAGAPIAERWTPSYKKSIIDSRVNTAKVILESIKRLADSERPKIIAGASAVGWYPSSTAVQSESANRADGFIGDVTEAWENSLHGFKAIGMRTVTLRIGLVLSPRGGFLSRLKPFFNLGLGSAIGDGKHWQSWIHIEDIVRLFHWTISNDSCSGVYNATAPESVTNLEMSRALARTMKRPFLAPNVPALVLRLVFGEMSSILIASHRIDSSRIQGTGFTYAYPTLEKALLSALK